MPRKHKAIVMGTSAGGLNALTAILDSLPGGFRLPIIVVQHRAKDHSNLLEEVLQAKCKCAIKQADEKERIRPGIVYIAPPDYHLLIESDHTFSLSADEVVSYSRPSIDVLFDTAAAAYNEELIGILLTGANSDGARGLLSIKARGGLTIVQLPADAEYAAMPQAAIDLGAAGLVLPLAAIPEELLKHNDG